MAQRLTYLEKENIQSNKEICFNCQNSKLIFDAGVGEMICNNCGVVINEQLDYFITEPAKVIQNLETNINKFMPSSLALFDKGLSTIISPENVDAFGNKLSTKQITEARSIRHWDKASNSNRSYHRNLKKAFGILGRIKDKLNLTESIIEKSAYYYRKVVDLKIIKGRSIKEFVVACVYVSCRELNIPRTLSEISEIVNADKVFAGKCYRLLLRRLKIKLDSIDLPTHLTKIASIAGVSRKTLTRALEMMSEVKDNPLSYGKDPIALSVAILYAAGIERGEKIKQSQIASAGNMSIVTLRKRFLDLKQIFPNLISTR